MATFSYLRESSRKTNNIDVSFFQILEGCLNEVKNVYDIELLNKMVHFCILYIWMIKEKFLT